ncbi:MAG: hypothetical protein ACM3L6_03600 [Deltaproteobacteria bacterium]
MTGYKDKALAFLRHRRSSLELACVLAIAVYLSCFGPALLEVRSDHMVGYADMVEYLQSFDSVLAGHIPYRDFYWAYGPLFLFVQLPCYLLFGANHNALFVCLYSYLPFLTVVLAYLWARLMFPNTLARLLFVGLCVTQGTAGTYPALRHLAAEIALAYFIVGLRSAQETKSWFWPGFLTGIALLTGLEYGLAAGFVILLGLAALRVLKHASAWIRRCGSYIAGALCVLAPFCVALAVAGALVPYLRFTFDYFTHFVSPASGDFIPPLPVALLTGGGNVFANLWHFAVSKDLRFYVPLATYAGGLLYFLGTLRRPQASRRGIEMLLLAAYGILVYMRMLSGPAYCYLVYGLVPSFTLGLFFLAFLIGKARDLGRRKRYFPAAFLALTILFAFAWFIATVDYPGILAFGKNLNVAQRWKQYTRDKVFDKRVGYFISPRAHAGLTQATQALEKRLQPGDTLFVYPWGPYNHLLHVASPARIRTIYDLAGPVYHAETIRLLEEHAPAYLALNVSGNNSGAVTMGGMRGDVFDCATWGTSDSPSFAGKGDPLQVYILEHYALDELLDYAAILKRRPERKPFVRDFTLVWRWAPGGDNAAVSATGLQPISEDRLFSVRGRRAEVVYTLPRSVACSHAEIVVRVKNAGLRRLVSKSRLRAYLRNGDAQMSENIAIIDPMTANKPQTIWMGFSGGRSLPVDRLALVLETPAPYMLPARLEVLDMKLLLEERPHTGGGPPAVAVAPAAPAEEDFAVRPATAEDVLIAGTFKTLARTFIAFLNLETLRQRQTKKLSRMSDEKFRGKFGKIYLYLKHMPDYVKLRYGIAPDFSREQALKNLAVITKEDMYDIVDAIPDSVIADSFQRLLRREGRETQDKDGLVKNINRVWSGMQEKAMKEDR